MLNIALNIILSLFFIVLGSLRCNAYDSINVHPKINEEAANQAINLGVALKRIGFETGIRSIVNNKEIYKWLREGGIKEDDPIYRANNHFHDPLKPWGSAGLSGNWLGMSSLMWAQNQELLDWTVGGDWSWKKARDSFRMGLTTTDKTVRDQNFANTFRSLGQIMHLLADSSVPAHTRNDIHVFPIEIFGSTAGQRQTYESWAKINWRDLTYLAKPVDPTIFSHRVPNAEAAVPVSVLWDQDKYIGTNPEVTWTMNPSVSEYGLAEYTNANYFSEDTIFTDYPHPKKENTDARATEQLAHDGTLDKVWYIMGYQTERLASLSFFWDTGLTGRWLYSLDDFVYRSYSDNLIPRAVGYSAGLLNYFFRGTLEISAPDKYVYSIIDGSRSPQQFTKLKAKVRNTTPNEAAGAGTLQAVARYKKRTDYRTDLSTDPPQPTSRETEFSYSVSASEEISALSSTIPKEVIFNFNESPIPAGITDLYLQVVFKGTLGNEQDTAVAVGMKDLLEPTHHTWWNLSDKFSLNGRLLTAGDIRRDPDLLATVTKNHDYIDPYNIDFWIVYYGTEQPETPAALASVRQLPAGRHIRLILLADSHSTNYARFTWNNQISPEGHFDFTFAAARNQDVDTVFNYTIPETFRSVRQHAWQGILNCDPVTAQGTCEYPENEAGTPSTLDPYPATISW